MIFNKDEYNDFLINSGSLSVSSTASYQLKSGKMSHWYMNLRNLSSTVKLAEETGRHVIKFIGDNISEEQDLTYIYGVPHGATKLALFMSIKSEAEKLVMGRGEVKEHGDPADRIVIGPMEKKDNIIVLEDVTTTGGSIAKEIHKLELVKPNILLAISLFDRSGGDAADVMENIKVPFKAMTTARELLERFREKHGDFHNAVSNSLKELDSGN